MSGLTRRGLVGAALAGSVIFVPRGARAQGTTPPPLPGAGGPPPLPGGAAPPPLPGGTAATVLQPGTRFVWYGSSASIPGEYQQLEPDYNGEWVDKATGRHYHESDVQGPAGAGYVVIDVLAAGAAGYLMGLSSYLIHIDAGNATTLIEANGLTSGLDSVPDFWILPERLAPYTDASIGATRVLHMPYTLSGRTYRALRIQVESGAGWSQTTYDLDTGLVIVSSSVTQGAAVLIRDPSNRLVPGSGNTMMTYSQIAGVRQTKLPGRGVVFPQAVQGLHALVYRGQRGILISGTQVPASPMEVRYDVTSTSPLFLTARMTASGYFGGPPTTVDRILPAGTIGSVWMNPAELQDFGQDQVIDQDPITGVQVVAVGRTSGLAVFSARTSLSQYTFGYDLRSGILSATDARVQVGPATDVTQLQLAGTQ